MYLIIWIAFGIVGGLIAESKGNSSFWGFILGVLLGPIGLLISLFTSENEEMKEKRKGNTLKCPYCANYIKKEATVCKHCGRKLESSNTDFNIERFRQ